MMKVKVTQPCPTLCDPMDYTVHKILQARILEYFSLLQEIFPTQGSNPDLLHCRQILYQLSPKGSPRILEWVACPFSRGSSRPRNRTGVSCIADGFFTNWAMNIWIFHAFGDPWASTAGNSTHNRSQAKPEQQSTAKFKPEGDYDFMFFVVVVFFILNCTRLLRSPVLESAL